MENKNNNAQQGQEQGLIGGEPMMGMNVGTLEAPSYMETATLGESVVFDIKKHIDEEGIIENIALSLKKETIEAYIKNKIGTVEGIEYSIEWRPWVNDRIATITKTALKNAIDVNAANQLAVALTKKANPNNILKETPYVRVISNVIMDNKNTLLEELGYNEAETDYKAIADKIPSFVLSALNPVTSNNSSIVVFDETQNGTYVFLNTSEVLSTLLFDTYSGKMNKEDFAKKHVVAYGQQDNFIRLGLTRKMM